MNPEVKAKWVDALRSSKYKQCCGRLKNGDRFCVIGVLTDLYIEEHDEKWSEYPEEDDWDNIPEFVEDMEEEKK